MYDLNHRVHRRRKHFLALPIKLFTNVCEADQAATDEAKRRIRAIVANLWAGYVCNASAAHEMDLVAGTPPMVAWHVFEAVVRASASKLLTIYVPRHDDGKMCEWSWILEAGHDVLMSLSRRSDERAQLTHQAAILLLELNAGGRDDGN